MDITTRHRVTAVDIAQRLGLAPTTVSHVLAGRAGRVRIKAETQERVLQTAREMGYRTNASARAMRTGNFGCAAFIQPLRHMFLDPALLVGLSRGLEEVNMQLSVAHVADDVFGDDEYLPKIVRELAADGLFINAAFDFPQGFLDAIATHRIPTVWINQRREADCVFPDDFTGGVMGARHLLALGHERVAFAVANPSDPHYSVAERRGGYEAAMRDAGLAPRTFSLQSPLPGDHRLEGAANMLLGPDRPTAVLAYEINTALPILVAAARCGLEVPRDLSLVTFHGKIEFYSGADVTTLVAGWEQIGREAVRALRRKIAEPDLSLPPLAVAPSLFAGLTCVPPRS